MTRLPLLSLWRRLSAPALFVLSFAGLVGGGTLGLLLLPGLVRGPRLPALDALFMVVSAVCVTGLAVVDVATRFTFWGQAWLLLLVQLGGLGLITLTTLIIGVLGRRLSLRSEMLSLPAARVQQVPDVVALTIAVARFTILVEAAGAVILWALWLPTLGVRGAVWPAVFHAVNAFCNAGFSTFSTSLVGWARRPDVLVVLSLLVVVGGIGYLTMAELVRWLRGRGPRRLSTHSYAALVTTALLLVVGAALYAAFEWGRALDGLPVSDKLANAWFMSVTARTAGFASLSYAAVGNETAYLTILLMMVGGSPGSTAGGIKTTALAILAALAVARMRGRRHVQIHDRSVPEGTVQRTVSLTLVSFALVTASILVLSATERPDDLARARATFLPMMFEAVSAFATVGLSMDVTPSLSPAGRVVAIVLMFLGRVGTLTFFAAIAIKARATADVRAAREDVIVG